MTPPPAAHRVCHVTAVIGRPACHSSAAATRARAAHHPPPDAAALTLRTPATMRTGIVCLLLSALVALALGAPDRYSSDELDLATRQMIGELAGRILRLARPASALGAQKRNSELINSLLGLPKIMNEAGR
ncbi:pigment-dispersing hormone type 1-like isoform X1 [Amphibalanus amphitrite]|uniref:pigment-dispersing hormone type 1-like isoform X1 n=1 Tax=Amphibalanus amphitrite TaxID=1232801 RepID=UPI001C90768A|nr:pigment-dispersing hormone type 1-like isoform X1 [Amphibalanus amphitrite]